MGVGNRVLTGMTTDSCHAPEPKRQRRKLVDLREYVERRRLEREAKKREAAEREERIED